MPEGFFAVLWAAFYIVIGRVFFWIGSALGVDHGEVPPIVITR
jgi:hypothetical protein